MAKEKTTPEVPARAATQPKALEVDAPLISSEVGGTINPSGIKDSYLTVDARMDATDITVKFSVKEAPELGLPNIVDSSGESGARKIKILEDRLTKSMGFTLRISYEGKAQNQVAVSQVKEVGVSFYPASESEVIAPRLLHKKFVNNTPTYDMHDHEGDETVILPLHPLAKAGDKVYCTVATEQDAVPHVFYTVIYDRQLTPDEVKLGGPLTPKISRDWLSRRKQWQSLTLQSAWITSGLPAKPPADVDPHLETRLPRNALEVQHRHTAALIVAPGLKLKPPHLRQSSEGLLNPELTKNGGNVDTPDLKTFKGDRVCIYVSGPGYGTKSLGCVTIEHDEDLVSVEMSPCTVASFFKQTMTLSYTIEFPNGDEPQWSPEQVVKVSVPTFPCPAIAEATNGTVRLKTFTGDAMATVPVWAYADCSKCCWMWVTGEDEDGEALRFDILKGEPVTDRWKAEGVTTSILRADLQKLADCEEFTLHFAASFCDACDWESAHEFSAQCFKIEQEALVLPKPDVTEAVDGKLTPWNGRNGLRIEVDYPANNPKHTISACWMNPDGSCWPLDAKPGSATGATIFLLPAEAMIPCMGTTVSITYTVTTKCKVQTSLPLNLKIELPTRLETPNVLEATPPRTDDAILDLRTFPNDARSLEDTMWFLRAGQKCWLKAEGRDKNNNPYSFMVYAARTITEAEVTAGVASEVVRAELEKAKDGLKMTFTFEVATDGKLNANVRCPPRILQVVTPPEMRYENFTAEATRLISAGQSISIPTMRISFISGPGEAGISSYSSTPGMLEGQALVLSNAVGQAPSPQHIRLDLTFTCKRVRFAYTWNHYATSFTFYSPAGDYLGRVSLNGNPLNGWVDYSAPENMTIGRIDISSGDWMYLDFFTFWL